MAAQCLPKYTKALTLRQSSVERKPTYHDVVLESRSLPPLKTGELLVRINAAAFNHKDVWIRMGKYPGIVIGSVLGGDGAGVVIASGNIGDPLLDKRVFLTPSRGWEKAPDAPESRFGILGGGSFPPLGTFTQYVVVERDQVILSPDHLDDVHAAAWPIGGVTAWRAVSVNANVQQGQNVLITGIGGGVALIALQLCIAKGASVYVTSGNPEKIQKAIALGAKGGANYKDKDWPAEIGALVQSHNQKGTMLDAVIDSGGGDILGQISNYLKQGGKVVCYGMTASPKITFTMREVLRNQQLLGSTMGSHKDLEDATRFIEKHHIVPIVTHVLHGLESAEEGFEMVKRGDHFGKVVIKMVHTDKLPKL